MTPTAWAVALAAPLAAFLVGGIPFGYLLARRRGVDLRQVGSGNIGANNASRALGRSFGRLIFALDALKGVVCTGLLAALLAGPLADWARAEASPAAIAQAAVAIAVVAGHIFSPYLGFRGGKGVATAFGALLPFWPALTVACLVSLVVWAATVLVTRYVSLGSILAAATILPNYLVVRVWLAPEDPAAGPLGLAAGVVGVLVVGAHHANIGRLLRGQEPRRGGPSVSSG